MTGQLQRLAALLREVAPTPGRRATPLPGVSVYRADEPTPLRATVYEPSVIVVAQGRKRAFLAGISYEYDPSSYLVLPITLPLDARVLEASVDRPFLSFGVRVEATALSSILSEAGNGLPFRLGASRGEAGRAIAVSRVEPSLLDASIRLFESLADETERRVLGPSRVRELLYRVLRGPQGDLLRAAAAQDGRVGRIARTLELIHRSFDGPIDVPRLAREAHMSESAFYEAFKSVTTRSPIQYLKEIRLSRARQILIWEGASARRAAARVGYASPSQFSREFKRRFGRPPGRERAWALASGEVEGQRPYE